MIVGSNGVGKCLSHSTQLRAVINNPTTKQKFEDYLNDKKAKEKTSEESLT